MMKSMPIDPGGRIDVHAKQVVRDHDGLDEPLLVIERTMGNAQMQHVGQVDASEKPKERKVAGANEHCDPWAEMRRGEISAAREIEDNDRVADKIVALHT